MALTKVGGLMIEGPILLSSGSEVTIAAGAITVTDNLHAVDTEADAASDDLETIAGGSDGHVLVLRAASSARTVMCKNTTGNLRLASDFPLDNSLDRLVLVHDTGNWYELSRSDNGA